MSDSRARLAELAARRRWLVERAAAQRRVLGEIELEFARSLRWLDLMAHLAGLLCGNWRVALSALAAATLELGPRLPMLRIWLSRVLAAYQVFNWVRAWRLQRAEAHMSP